MFTNIVDLANIYKPVKTELENIEFESSYGRLKFEISFCDAPEALQDTIDAQHQSN